MNSFFTGPFAGILMKKYSWRLLAIAGGVIVAFGLAVSRFATGTVVLCLTFGVISGLLRLRVTFRFTSVRTLSRFLPFLVNHSTDVNETYHEASTKRKRNTSV